jgi:hypothetical protein
MDYLPTLRLSFPGGATNSYRIRENRVEFQINHGSWRVLEHEDVRLHFLLKTEVAHWLLRESRTAIRMGTSGKAE